MGLSALQAKEYILIFVLLLAYWLQGLRGIATGEGAGISCIAFEYPAFLKRIINSSIYHV